MRFQNLIKRRRKERKIENIDCKQPEQDLESRQSTKHITGLPIELLEIIIGMLIYDDKGELYYTDRLNLSATCRKFHKLLAQHYIYSELVIRSKTQAQKLGWTLSKNKQIGQLVQCIVFKSPSGESSRRSVSIGRAGYTYELPNDQTTPSWSRLIPTIMDQLPHVSQIILDDISGALDFSSYSLSSSSALSSSSSIDSTPTDYCDVILSGDSHTRVLFSSDLVKPFIPHGIKTLSLYNLVVDKDSKLISKTSSSSSTSSNPSLEHPRSSVKKLTISGCIISTEGLFQLSDYFANVTFLSVENVKDVASLELALHLYSLECLHIRVMTEEFSNSHRSPYRRASSSYPASFFNLTSNYLAALLRHYAKLPVLSILHLTVFSTSIDSDINSSNNTIQLLSELENVDEIKLNLITPPRRSSEALINQPNESWLSSLMKASTCKPLIAITHHGVTFTNRPL